MASKVGLGAKSGLGRTTAGAKSSGSKLQVFLNGKIVTPQSLIYASRKAATKDAFDGGQVTDSGIDDNTDMKISTEGHHDGVTGTRKASTIGTTPKSGGVGHKDLSSIGSKKREEELVEVEVGESSTQIVFSLPSLTAANDSKDVVYTEERNKKYEELKVRHENPDGYVPRACQTINNPTNFQNEMAAPNALRDMGANATEFDIKDAMNNATAGEEDTLLTGKSDNANDDVDPTVQKFIDEMVILSEAIPGCMLDTQALSKPPVPEDRVKSKRRNNAASGTSNANTSNVGQSQTDLASGVSQSLAGGSNTNATSTANAGAGTSNNASGVNLAAQSSTGGGGKSGSFTKTTSASQTGTGPEGVAEFTEQDSMSVLLRHSANEILKNPKLRSSLEMLERAVQQNAHHTTHLDYRNLPDINPVRLVNSGTAEAAEAADANNGGLGGGGFGGGGFGGAGFGSAIPVVTETPAEDIENKEDKELADENDLMDYDESIRRLFTFSSPLLVQDRPVTAMAWNPANKDLLAVCYGKFDFNFEDPHVPGTELNENHTGGLVLFWSLRNPEHPEKVLRTPHPVTSLDFSSVNPMLLAVGCYNGDVAVYNLRKDDWSKPAASSVGVVGGHTEPVWQLKWIKRGKNDSVETLVSTSTDGNVYEWSMKKGLEFTTLMQLVRSGLGDGWISRQASALCMDFVPESPQIYIVGTEDGTVHKCSTAYSEQYLETYDKHHSPVYKVRCCKHWPEIFITSSADWNISLYHMFSKKPLISLTATANQTAVLDINWCPGNSSVFASVTDGGFLQIWDLEKSCIDPVVNHNTTLDVLKAKPPKPEETEEEEGEPGTRPGTHLTAVTAPSHKHHQEKVELAPVSKLLDNLKTARGKEIQGEEDSNADPDACRKLSCVLFGLKAPTIVVGDRRGVVTLYRVDDPVLVTNQGPVQQTSRLQAAIISQTDPAEVAKLAEKGFSYNPVAYS